MASKVEAAVEVIVEKLLEGTELECVDVEYVKEQNWYLRVFIDKAGGIDIDDCQSLSGRLEPELDKLELLRGSYILEVSSPGLDRELKKEKDFLRHQGAAVDVTLYAPLDGQKVLTGVLKDFTPETLTVDERVIPRAGIAKIRLHLDF